MNITATDDVRGIVASISCSKSFIEAVEAIKGFPKWCTKHLDGGKSGVPYHIAPNGLFVREQSPSPTEPVGKTEIGYLEEGKPVVTAKAKIIHGKPPELVQG
ncbi:MAG: hypothetical protein J0L77_04870 [Alphaproteobacteria bacterium]|nr:hypothetical protein [Alphaproteobacteria bacterium]